MLKYAISFKRLNCELGFKLSLLWQDYLLFKPNLPAPKCSKNQDFTVYWSDKYSFRFYLYFGTLLMAQIWRKHVPKEALIETLEKWRPNKWIITELNDNTIFRKDILLLVVESKEENFENWLKILKIERLNSKSGICCQTSMFTVHSDGCIIR